MEHIIKPYAKAPLWLVRVGLYLLFPPIFLFVARPIGYLVASSEGAVTLFGFLISLSVASFFAVRMAYSTSFELTPKTASYNLNFLWSRRKEVLFTNVKEVELKAGLLQKLFGLGTIVLHTQASSTGNNKTGLSLSDIENPSHVYEQLKQAVAKARDH